MNKKRIFAFLAACLLILLPACKPKNSQSATREATANSISGYQIIVPATLDSEARAAVTQLMRLVDAELGIILPLAEDDITEPGEKEILIGATNRGQSVQIAETLKYEDYYVGMINGKLVVCGGSGESTAQAVQKLIAIVTANLESGAFFHSDRDQFEYRYSYHFTEVSINGVPASQYTILYANAHESREHVFARLLQKEIRTLCGAELTVQSDAKKKATGNCIYFGGTNPAAGSETAQLSANNGIVYVSGSDHDIFFATQTLLSRLKQSADGTVTVAASESLTYTYSDLNLSEYGIYPEAIKVMSYNLQNAGQNPSDPTTKYPALAKMMDLSKADIIAVQECVTIAAANGIRNKLKNKDAFEVIAYEGINNAILYNKTLYKLVDQGKLQIGAKDDENGSDYDRWHVWAKFRSLESGVEFVVSPVHTDFDSACRAQVKLIIDFMEKNFPDTPAILMGDFNLPESKLNIEDLAEAGYSSARRIAATSPNRDEVTFPKHEYIIDYIFVKGMTAKTYEVMMQMQSDPPSDHRPIRAELYIG